MGDSMVPQPLDGPGGPQQSLVEAAGQTSHFTCGIRARGPGHNWAAWPCAPRYCGERGGIGKIELLPE